MRRLIRIIVGVLLLIGCGFLWRMVAAPFFENGFNQIFTEPVPGNERAFDPIASFPAVQAFAGDTAQFTEMRVNLVRSDGTVDFGATAYTPTVTYEFVQPTTRPADAPPVGAGGSLTDRWFQEITVSLYTPGVWRNRTVTGGGVRTRTAYLHRGMDRDIDEPRADVTFTASAAPRCPLADLWQVALDAEAPADAVANVTYVNEAYDFWIQGTSFRYRFNAACEVQD
jgi:hypothetical protein